MSKLPDPLSKEEVEEYRQDEEKEHNPSNTPAGCLTCALIATIDERDREIKKLKEALNDINRSHSAISLKKGPYNSLKEAIKALKGGEIDGYRAKDILTHFVKEAESYRLRGGRND